MATQEVTSPMALDATLQNTNTALGLLGKDTTLQSIVTALASIGINTIGNLASLITTDKTSLVGAVNEVAGDVSDLDTAKADKVESAVNNNFAKLDANGNLADSGITTDQTTTAVSGNPISIANLKSAQIAKNPIITFEPIQAGSGTPSPSNVRAISGYDNVQIKSCGKNLFDKSKAIDGKRMTSDGSIIDGAAYSVSDYIPVKPNTVYYLSHVMGISSFYTSGTYTKDKTFIELKGISGDGDTSGSITTSSNAAYIRVNMLLDNKNSVQIEENNQATTYEPYTPAVELTDSLGQTVYGGSLDVRTGLFTVTHGMIDLGSLTWVGEQIGGINRFQAVVSASMAGSSGGINVNFITEVLKADSAPVAGMGVDNTICFYDANSNLYARCDTYNDASAFQTAMSGKKLVYELATPFTIQLTPHEIALSQGYNYISTNGTSISLAYHNGEVATHADVEQLAETVNELGDNKLDKVPKSISVTKQGTETYKQVIKRLYNLIDWNQVNPITSKLLVVSSNGANYTGTVLTINFSAHLVVAQWFAGASHTVYIYSILVYGDSSTMDFVDVINDSKSDVTNNEAASGWKLILYY